MPETSPKTSEYRLLTPALLTRLGRLELLAQRAVTGVLQAGIHRSRRLGSGQEFEQYRRYVPGDDLRQLDWHLFARTDQLHCRLQAPDTAARVALVLDTSASMGYAGNESACSKLRCASIVAACIAYLAERQGDELGLFSYGQAKRSGSGRTGAFREVCSQLETLTAAGEEHASARLAEACDFVRGRGLVIWISDFLGEENTLETTLRAFHTASRACYAFQVLDTDEVEFKLTGARRFLDPEGSREVLAEAEKVREEYLRRIKKFRESVRDACAKQGVPLAQITAQDDLGTILSGLLR